MSAKHETRASRHAERKRQTGNGRVGKNGIASDESGQSLAYSPSGILIFAEPRRIKFVLTSGSNARCASIACISQENRHPEDPQKRTSLP